MYTSIATGLFLATGLLGADVAVFVGPTAGPGNVEIRDAAGIMAPILPAKLQSIRLLPVDFSGRTELDRLSPDRPAYHADVPGASRLALSGRLGSLYRFRRDEAGGTSFGLFRVDAAGNAAVVWEHRGSGPGSDVDPFVPTLAVDPSGSTVLVATTVAAGGNLFEIELASGATIERTALLPPQSFSRAGLFLRDDWGIGAGSTGVFRFGRSATAQATPVTFPGTAPAWFSGEIALSGDGHVAATTAGFNRGRQFVYTFTLSGSARRITDTPNRIAPAGYLPDHGFGPYLALSQDGSKCAWVTERATREAFYSEDSAPQATPPLQIGPVGTLPVAATTPVQLTSDALYLDTLDEIGVLFFSPALILAVGERGGGPGTGIEQIDLYRVDPSLAATPDIKNLSQSSGTAAPPFFTKSSIQPEAILRIPGTDGMLVLDGDLDQLLLVEADGTTSTLLFDQCKEIQIAEMTTPDCMLLGLRRTNPLDSRDVISLEVQQPRLATVITSVTGGYDLDRAATSADGWASLVIGNGSEEWLGRLHVPTGVGSLVYTLPLIFGPTSAIGTGGAMDFTIDVPTFPDYVMRRTATGPVTLTADVPEGFLLPGI